MTPEVNPETSKQVSPKPKRASPLAIILCVISAVAIALAAVSAYLYFGPDGTRDTAAIDQTRDEVAQASSDQAVAMFQYDYNNVDQQLHAATDGLTGDFQGTFTNLIESVIIPGAKEKSLTVQVVVQGARFSTRRRTVRRRCCSSIRSPRLRNRPKPLPVAVA